MHANSGPKTLHLFLGVRGGLASASRSCCGKLLCERVNRMCCGRVGCDQTCRCFRRTEGGFHRSNSVRRRAGTALSVTTTAFRSGSVRGTVELCSTTLSLTSRRGGDGLVRIDLAGLTSLCIVSGQRVSGSLLRQVRLSTQRSAMCKCRALASMDLLGGRVSDTQCCLRLTGTRAASVYSVTRLRCATCRVRIRTGGFRGTASGMRHCVCLGSSVVHSGVRFSTNVIRQSCFGRQAGFTRCEVGGQAI